jgi:hypothetical protein
MFIFWPTMNINDLGVDILSTISLIVVEIGAYMAANGPSMVAFSGTCKLWKKIMIGLVAKSPGKRPKWANDGSVFLAAKWAKWNTIWAYYWALNKHLSTDGQPKPNLRPDECDLGPLVLKKWAFISKAINRGHVWKLGPDVYHLLMNSGFDIYRPTMKIDVISGVFHWAYSYIFYNGINTAYELLANEAIDELKALYGQIADYSNAFNQLLFVKCYLVNRDIFRRFRALMLVLFSKFGHDLNNPVHKMQEILNYHFHDDDRDIYAIFRKWKVATRLRTILMIDKYDPDLFNRIFCRKWRYWGHLIDIVAHYGLRITTK